MRHDHNDNEAKCDDAELYVAASLLFREKLWVIKRGIKVSHVSSSSVWNHKYIERIPRTWPRRSTLSKGLYVFDCDVRGAEVRKAWWCKRRQPDPNMA